MDKKRGRAAPPDGPHNRLLFDFFALQENAAEYGLPRVSWEKGQHGSDVVGVVHFGLVYVVRCRLHR